MERSQLNKGSYRVEGGRQDRLSASSPDKRRLMSSRTVPAPPVRLIPRGGEESDDEEAEGIEVIRRQVSPNSLAAQYHQTILDTSASRKRKILNNPPPSSSSSSAVIVLPSPTTQIAKRIDSINLESLHQRPSALSIPGSSVSPLRQEGERSSSFSQHLSVVHEGAMDVSSNAKSRSRSGSPSVPVVGHNVEIPANDDELMEKYLQRPPEATNMKRVVPSDDEGHSEEPNRRLRGNSKIPRTTSGVQQPQGLSQQSLRVPTIHQSPSLLKKKHFSSSTHQASSPSTALPSSLTFPLLPLMLPIVSSSPTATLTPPILQASPTNLSSSSHQTKTKNVSSFTINDLLAKKPASSSSSRQQATPTITTTTPTNFPYINPTLLLIYQQQYMMAAALAAASNKVPTSTGLKLGGGGGGGGGMEAFQGEAAEKDYHNMSSASLHGQSLPNDDDEDEGLLTLPSAMTILAAKRHQSDSPRSNRYSPRASPAPTTDSTASTGGGSEEREERLPSVTPPVEGVPAASSASTSGGGGVGLVGGVRQNALLQVGEAHLAILPDEDGDTPLHLSIIQENIPLTFYLVRLITGVSMNLDIANNLRQTPLHLAVITGQPMLVNLLVQAGASVNCPDRRGNTCIHLAAQRKNVSVLQILSQAESHTPEYNARNFAGLTPVHVATREGSIDVLKFLFQMGANRNMADSCSGRTALHYAVEAQNFQMCNFLLENNVNVNAVTFSGNTPLHVAAGRRLKEIVALLMAYGANPSIANGEGDFPSDLPASLLMQRAKMSTK